MAVKAATRKLTTAEELVSLRHWVQQGMRECVRVNERIPAVEKLQAELTATKQYLAVQVSHVARLVGEKAAREAYIANLEDQIRARP